MTSRSSRRTVLVRADAADPRRTILVSRLSQLHGSSELFEQGSGVFHAGPVLLEVLEERTAPTRPAVDGPARISRGGVGVGDSDTQG